MDETESVAGEGEAVSVRVEEEGQFVVLGSDKLNILCVPEDLEDAIPIALVVNEVLAGKESVDDGE